MVAAIVLGTCIIGHAVDTPPAELPLIVGLHNVWNVGEQSRDQRFRVQTEVAVNYYDPSWRLLWCQEGDRTFFLQPPEATRLPIRSGQFVRLVGEVVPSAGLRFSALSAEVLGEDNGVAPLVVAGRLADSATFNEGLIEVEGFVDRQDTIDPAHIGLVILSEGRRIAGTVLLEEGGTVPWFEGALVRARGVYQGRTAPGQDQLQINLTIPGIARIAIAGWLKTAPQFERPARPVSELPDLPRTSLVRVVGRIHTLAPGRCVTVRDDTGQVDLLTPQEHGLRVGDLVEGVGLPAVDGSRWQLREALVRPVATGPIPTAALAPAVLLRLAGEVLALDPEAAAARQPVQLLGVVTWSAPGTRFLYLQDPSGGVRVEWSDAATEPPAVGTGISVRGVSTMEGFAPGVSATRIRTRSAMTLPEPRRISLALAETGTEEARWVELEGLLRDVRRNGPWLELDLTTPTGRFLALLPPSTELKPLKGSFVRVQGVCSAVANDLRQLVSIRLWVPGTGQIALLEARPADLFALPAHPISSLRRFGPLQGVSHWLRTGGTVTYVAPGRFAYIQDGVEGLTVFPVDETPLTPGDRVEVVGVPGRDGARSVLREAVVRRIGGGPDPVPTALESLLPLKPVLDTRLISVAGQLTDVVELDNEWVLTLRRGTGTVLARVDAPAPASPPAAWRSGSLVRAAGVYRIRYDEFRHPTGFDLLMRSPSDLEVVQAASWWTAARALGAAGGLGVLLALIAAWSLVLRRKVWRQDLLIRDQLAQKARLEAELERAQRLHSLGTMAGGIAHDFNNLLTIVMGNLALASFNETAKAAVGPLLLEAEKGAARGRDLAQQLLTFARGGDPVREVLALPPLAHDAVALALSGSNVRAAVHPADGLWLVHADRAQTSRAIHHLLVHAKAAMPGGGVVTITLVNSEVLAGDRHAVPPGRYVRMTVADCGPGIPADRLPGIFDPYATAKLGSDRFGLATAYSIARKHGGTIEAESAVGTGTTFTVWWPAAPADAALPPAPTPTGPLSGRVLVMDDEESIRRISAEMLRRLGCEPTTVEDGSACVRLHREARAAGRPFDLVIMDLTVPGGMGGKEAIAELRRIDPGVRAIVCSGYSNDPIMAQFREYGFVGVVPKPFEAEVLAQAVGRALAGRR